MLLFLAFPDAAYGACPEIPNEYVHKSNISQVCRENAILNNEKIRKREQVRPQENVIVAHFIAWKVQAMSFKKS